MPDPTFLYIGAARAGSTWMYEILREHPDVFVPVAKDIYFFDKHYGRGLEWYRSFFESAGGRRAIGELSHDYYLSAEAAVRIARDLPDVRLICCLREPLDWALSAYVFNQGTGHSAGLTFEQYIRRPQIVHQIQYAARLTPFFGLFPRSRMKVLFFDQLQNDSEGFARQLYEYIGVDPAFESPTIQTRVNAAHKPRLQLMPRAAYRIGGLLRASGAANIVGAIKRHRLTERFLYRPRPERPAVDPAVAAGLRQSLAEDLAALQRLLGRPLPAGWLQGQERDHP